MKRVTKSALLISTAFLACLESGNNILAMQRGTPPPPPSPGMQPPQPGAGMLRGGPPAPPQAGARGGPGGVRGGLRGGPVQQPGTQQQAPVPRIPPVTQLCNECAGHIEVLLRKKVLTPEAMQKIGAQNGDKENNIKEFMEPYVLTAKNHILKRIGELLSEEFEFLDHPVPDEGKVIGIVKQSCTEVEGKLDLMIAAVVQAQQAEGKSKKSIQQGESVESGGNTTQRKLRNTQQGGTNPQQSASENPFQVILKKSVGKETKVELTPMEAAEKEIEAIQPTSSSDMDKKAADRQRLVKIKDFLVAKKGADFVSQFTDPELLAFQLHVIVDLQPSDLENKGIDGFNGKKFSDKALEYVKDIRFSRDPGTNIVAHNLTAEQVKNSNPKDLLRHTLGMSDIRINELIRNNHLIG